MNNTILLILLMVIIILSAKLLIESPASTQNSILPMPTPTNTQPSTPLIVISKPPGYHLS